MNRVPQPFIDDLLNRSDIVEIVDTRVKLKKTGKNYSACCPFHNEKTPSFTVSPDKQFYYCFGCGASGTALSFIMEFDRLSFVDSIELLAKKHGLSVPREQQLDRQQSSFSQNLYNLLDNASRYYQEQLAQHPKRSPAVRYLNERGLSEEIMTAFGVGYAPPGWDNLMNKLGVTDKDRKLLIEGGLVIRSDDGSKQYDRFRHRIIFPILDIRGRTIGFGGRILEIDSPTGPNTPEKKSGPKYLNSPETPVFHKGRELYGLHQARQANRKLEQLVVVEGYMDVIALAQYGITCAVATLGTACGEDHLKLAFRFTNTVIFCFDGDNAGRKAAQRALENSLTVMRDGLRINFLFLAEGQDPDSLVRTIGAERFNQQLKQSIPLEEFLFDVCSENIDVQTMEGRAQLSKAAVPLIHKLPKSVFRELMFDHLAKRTGLSRDVLMELTEAQVEKESPTAIADSLSIQQNPLRTDSTHQYYQQTQAHNPADKQTHNHLSGTKPTVQQHNAHAGTRRKLTHLSPARTAIALLLNSPETLHQLENIAVPDSLLGSEAIQLRRLIEYLSTRPHCSFPNIIGYWLGHFGLQAQQELIELAALELLNDAKRMAEIDITTELADVFAKLNKDAAKLSIKEELTSLQELGFASMTHEQKQRYKELLLLQQH